MTHMRFRVGNLKAFVYPSFMGPLVKHAIPVLPAADTEESLRWWTTICGFEETFRDNTPPNYAGVRRGEAYVHISGMSDKALAAPWATKPWCDSP
jgi:hypothetical protein